MERQYQKLNVWQCAMTLVTEIYRSTASFPDQEKYGLISQMRRAAVSIPSNIAEGSSRNSDRDFGRFLNLALGSLTELETQIYISKRLGYLKFEKDLLELTNKIFAMLTNLTNRLRASDLKRQASGQNIQD